MSEDSGVPTIVAERLRELHARDGELTEYAVLDDASHKASPLHGYFEWDDTEAARRWRLEQAGQLIRRVKVRLIRTPESPPIRVRAYVARRDVDGESTQAGTYLSVDEVVGDQAREQALRAQMERDFQRLRRRYDDMSAFLQLCGDLLMAEAS